MQRMRTRRSFPKVYLLTLLTLLLYCAMPARCWAIDWTYSVPAENGPNRRAYLWIPPNCQRVRAVLIGLQNMLERPMFEDPSIRQACQDAGLGIVWISPMNQNNVDLKLTQKMGPEALNTLQQLLADLAKESGYKEVEFVPWVITSHSAASPFGFGVESQKPDRVAVFLPFRGWIAGGLKPGIPTLHVTSEYAEVGGAKWGEVWMKDIASSAKLRAQGRDHFIGQFCDIGAGHFEWTPTSGSIFGLFLKKAIAARLPADGPLDAPTKLNAIDPDSGYLIEPAQLGKPETKPISAKLYQGDPSKALWYIDEEMATTINRIMAENLQKKPQVVDFLDHGQPMPLDKGGNPTIPVHYLDDGVSFRVEAGFLDKAPSQIYQGVDVGHASGPILFRVSTGALRQTGPDTFKVWLGRGGVEQQSSPWEPWIMAWSPGDDQYRRADRPGRPVVLVVNKDGAPQTIDFPKINDAGKLDHVVAGVTTLALKATASSGLPVQFFPVSGPVELKDDTTLEFLPVPPRSKFPVRVIVGAYQWGRRTGTKVQSAGPVYQEFFIDKLEAK